MRARAEAIKRAAKLVSVENKVTRTKQQLAEAEEEKRELERMPPPGSP